MSQSLRPPASWMLQLPPFKLNAQTPAIRNILWYSPRHASLLASKFFLRQAIANGENVAEAKDQIYDQARRIREAQHAAIEEKQS